MSNSSIPGTRKTLTIGKMAHNTIKEMVVETPKQSHLQSSPHDFALNLLYSYFNQNSANILLTKSWALKTIAFIILCPFME